MKTYHILIPLLPYITMGAAVAADDPKIILNLDGEAVSNYCIYDNRLFSEGAVYKTNDGKEYVCHSVSREKDMKPNLVWKKQDKQG